MDLRVERAWSETCVILLVWERSQVEKSSDHSCLCLLLSLFLTMLILFWILCRCWWNWKPRYCITWIFWILMLWKLVSCVVCCTAFVGGEYNMFVYRCCCCSTFHSTWGQQLLLEFFKAWRFLLPLLSHNLWATPAGICSPADLLCAPYGALSGWPIKLVVYQTLPMTPLAVVSPRTGVAPSSYYPLLSQAAVV
jgi:hypothetical protein